MSLDGAARAYLAWSRAAIQWVAALVLVIMVLINGAEIIYRVSFVRGLNWVQELSIILAMTLYFLTYALIAKDREYIRVQILGRSLSQRGRHVLGIAIRLVVLLFHGMLAWYAIKTVKFTALFETPVLSLPEYVFFLPLALGCLDIVVTEMIYLVRQLAGDSMDEERPAVLI